jgi:SAM-dependent methyltransferase
MLDALKKSGFIKQVQAFRRRRYERRVLGEYMASRVPFSQGYSVFRNQFIHATLTNPSLIEMFRQKKKLPDNFGFGLDERCVEYAFAFSHMPASPDYVLDAGSVLNHDFILSAMENAPWKNAHLHILTLAPERYAAFNWNKGISYFYDDLRRMPMRDQLYDVVMCISTLEHVGMDNSHYTGQSEVVNHHDFAAAMAELRRVIRPGGALLLTVPFGRYQAGHGYQQFDLPLLEKAIEAFGPNTTVERTFYRYRKEGWQIAPVEECQDAEYIDWVMLGKKNGPFPIQPDGAAAARAVACLRLTIAS